MGSAKGELVEDAFKGLGIAWKSFVSNKLPVLNWPEEVLRKAKEGKLAFEKAKILARVKDENNRGTLLSRTVSESLSVADIKECIDLIGTDNKKDEGPKKNSPSDATKILKAKVSKTFQKLIKNKTLEKVMSDEIKSARIHALIEEIETLMT